MLGVQIAKLDEDLNGAASTVRIDIEEPLLKHVEEGIDLAFVILAPLLYFLFAEHSDQVATDLNDGASKSV
jgi:hypothetical protein